MNPSKNQNVYDACVIAMAISISGKNVHLVDALIAQSHKVTVLDVLSTGC